MERLVGILAIPIGLGLLGCTVFVLTNDEHTLFFNNENTAVSNTHIWFIPGGEDYYGAVYVGLDDGGAQGGMNTEGLALDWVAQFDEEWVDTQDRPMVRGNFGERMLEECATVAEAVAFFKKYYHPTFARTRALIADRTGASVIIGAEDGEALIEWSNQSRGFGTGFDDRMMQRMASNPPDPTIENGFEILHALMEGDESDTPTLYSSAFDLRTGQIYIRARGEADWTVLHLDEELGLGPHFYTMESLHEENPKPRPLQINMHRSLTDAFPPAAVRHDALTGKVGDILAAFRSGTATRESFSESFWNSIRPELNEIRSEMTMLGDLQSIVLVELEKESPAAALYRIEFAKGIGIARVRSDAVGRVSEFSIAAFEPKGRD